MTLDQHSIPKSTFYEWYGCYLEKVFEGLQGKASSHRGQWNKIPEEQRQEVVETALEYSEKSPEELAFHIIDHHVWFISESSVYLKVVHWGWYYLTTILDDYSMYIVAWERCNELIKVSLNFKLPKVQILQK